MIQKAFIKAAGLTPIAEDTIFLNAAQNIIVVSTPTESRAEAFANVRSFHIGQVEHETHTYRAAADNTCKGVVRGFFPETPTDEVHDLIINNPRNPTAISLRRLGGSGTFVILFEGLKVPNFVYAGASPTKCTLYKKQLDICHACGRIGHRTDVCPTPDDVLCRGCGIHNPPKDHTCTPVCRLCGGEHLLGDYRCKNKFQVPYIVRRRRWEQKAKEEEGLRKDDADWPSLPPERGRSKSRGNRRAPGSSRSRSRNGSRNRSRSQSPATKEVSWADRSAAKVRGGTSPEQTAIQTMQEQLQKALKQVEEVTKQNKQLKQEIVELKRTRNTSLPTHEEPAPKPTAGVPAEGNNTDRMDESPPTRKRPKNPDDTVSLEDRVMTIEEAVKSLQQQQETFFEAFNHTTARLNAMEQIQNQLVANVQQLTSSHQQLSNDVQTLSASIQRIESTLHSMTESRSTSITPQSNAQNSRASTPQPFAIPHYGHAKH